MKKTSGSLQHSGCFSLLPFVKGEIERQRAAPESPGKATTTEGGEAGLLEADPGRTVSFQESLASGSDTPRFDFLVSLLTHSAVDRKWLNLPGPQFPQLKMGYQYLPQYLACLGQCPGHCITFREIKVTGGHLCTGVSVLSGPLEHSYVTALQPLEFSRSLMKAVGPGEEGGLGVRFCVLRALGLWAITTVSQPHFA